jgi:GTPase
MTPTNTEAAGHRVVAIVGRPNVGKSALFNRIAGIRLAIVHEEVGVTRDRITREVIWRDQRFELIDTGGIGFIDKAKTDDSIARGTRSQVDVAIQDAAVVIFVTDITSGVVPLDQEVAKLLRVSGKKVFVAANKVDHAQRETGLAEFERLGFPVLPVSALHGRGVDTMMQFVLAELPPAEKYFEKGALRVAIVGRPNVGKSSYINKLLGSERVIVSEVPGTTRDSIEIPFAIGAGNSARHYTLIDTAGMRKVGKVHGSVERFSLFRAEQSIEHADVVVLMLDAEQGPTVQDKKIAAKILDEKKGCVLIVNKWDLAQGIKPADYEAALRKVMFFLNFAPMRFVSAKSGFNMKESIDVIDEVASQVRATLTTGLLNRVMRDAFDRVQPPMVQGKRLKYYYCTQTGTRPLRVRFFVNETTRLTPAYRSYLLSALRKVFGLEGAPVILDFRSSHDLTPNVAEKNPRKRQ